MQLYVRDRISLAPGAAQTIEFEITPDQLSFLDRQMERRVEPGTFDLMIGGSSEQMQIVQLEVLA